MRTRIIAIALTALAAANSSSLAAVPSCMTKQQVLDSGHYGKWHNVDGRRCWFLAPSEAPKASARKPVRRHVERARRNAKATAVARSKPRPDGRRPIIAAGIDAETTRLFRASYLAPDAAPSWPEPMASAVVLPTPAPQAETFGDSDADEYLETSFAGPAPAVWPEMPVVSVMAANAAPGPAHSTAHWLLALVASASIFVASGVWRRGTAR